MPINSDCSDTTTHLTLAEIRTSIVYRLGYSAVAGNLPPGMLELLNTFIVDAQRSLSTRYTSLRTQRWFSWTLTAGERFYAIGANDEAATCPKVLDPLRFTWAGYSNGSSWRQLNRGIPPNLIGYETTGTPTHYDISQTLEIWPAPAVTEGELRIRGTFAIEPLVADADQTTIDSHAVYLLALANAKAHYGKPDAGNLISELEVYLRSLVAGTHNGRRYIPSRDGDQQWIYVEPRPVVPFA